MKFSQVIVAGIYSVCATAYGADTISIQHGHPLGILSLELQKRYGYAVTYEEAPFDAAKLQATKLPNGVLFLSIPPMSIVFQIPEMTVGQPVPAALNRIPVGLPDVVLPLLAEYVQAGGGAMFSVLFEGGYAHIVPTNRVVNGAAEPFQPILGTMVTMSVSGSSCSQALDSLLDQVNAARGVHVVEGVVPIGPLMGHSCVLNVNNLPARDVLASILHQAGAGGDPSLRARYSWALLHDPNTDKYFLSTSIVPNLNPNALPPASPPTVNPPATVTTDPNAPSRLSVPSGKQQ